MTFTYVIGNNNAAVFESGIKMKNRLDQEKREVKLEAHFPLSCRVVLDV